MCFRAHAFFTLTNPENYNVGVYCVCKVSFEGSEVVTMKKLLVAIIAFILALIAVFILGILIFLFDGTSFMKPLLIAVIVVLLFIWVAS